jgi:hypothetical protein
LRHHDEKAKRVALTHGEEEAAGAGGEFLEVGVRALRHLYRTRASQRGKFYAWDSTIARADFFLPRRFGAFAGGVHER